jgi:hypothetical protein
MEDLLSTNWTGVVEMKKERITELRKLRCQDVNRAIVYECLDEIERLQEELKVYKEASMNASLGSICK